MGRCQLFLSAITSLVCTAALGLSACAPRSSSDAGSRPSWANELSSEMRYGYGDSLPVSDIGTRVATYQFASQGTAVSSDSRSQPVSSVKTRAKVIQTAQLTDPSQTEVATASAAKLQDEHRIILANGSLDDAAKYQDWTTEKAFLFYKSVEDLPTSLNQDQGVDSVFVLSKSSEAREILELTSPPASLASRYPSARFYKVTATAFDYTNIKDLFGPNAIKARYLDNQFFKEYIAMFLYDVAKLTQLIEKRYAYKIAHGTPDYLYQDFTTEELILIISLIEDLPPFFKPIAGIGELHRRHNADSAGLNNTIVLNGSALEFYLAAYTQLTVHDFQAELVAQLALAWYNSTLDRDKVLDWNQLSGWHVDSSGRWKPSKTENIVSTRALGSPAADFADSVAHYVVFPLNLLRLAKEKYEFIFGIMGGYQYRVTANQQYQIQIISANPDLTAPVVDVHSLQVDTFVNADGYYTVKVRLNVDDNLSGVAGGVIEVYSAIYCKHRARGYFSRTSTPGQWEAVLTISRFAEKGKWNLSYITFSDQVRNTARYTSENIGWDLNLPDNGYPVDKEAPTIGINQISLDYFWNSTTRTHQVYVSVPVSDNLSERLHGNISAAPDADYDYAWGQFLGYNPAKKMMYFVLEINEYQAGGTWRIYYVGASDELCNTAGFDLDPLGKRITFKIDNSQRDKRAPRIQADTISVKMTEEDPQGHNGGYLVEVLVTVSDDLSGISYVTATLMSPSGQQWSGGAQVASVVSGRPEGTPGGDRRPQGWGKPPGYDGHEDLQGLSQTLKISIYLPAHIEGGTWLLASITAADRAKNYAYVDLTRRAISISP